MLDGHHLYPDYLADLRGAAEHHHHGAAALARYLPHHHPHPHHHHHHHPAHHHPHHHLPPPPHSSHHHRHHYHHHHPHPATVGPPPPPPPPRSPTDAGTEHPVNLYGMTMVERYLYSLPEYRTEMQRSNFIEIYSYNGLLATRKVIEFDGDTVLCRVCGDKASGFHYGVHACEGCKGFFRRSIQQKIQYRPCLKNQQCNIMRVNRNRCQYCRLKKCIAVGMSRDAVRFGRVPKKEKAKIMEQMHKVNSQSQVTLLNTILENGADITHKVVEAHLRTCEFTHVKLRAFLDKAWQNPQFVTCPAHMACPLNPSPETSDGTKKWDEFSECFTPAIRNVVNFAKCIPGFQLLSQEDQVTLLKAGTFEVLLVHLACLFDAQTNTMCFANGKLYKRVSLTVTNSAGFLLDSMFDFAERLNTMQLSDDEIGLFSAIVIIAADRPGLRNVEQVERVQNRITQALQTLMSSKHPDDPALFAKLLMKIPDLRTLNTLHSEKLLGLTVPAGSGKNGASGDKSRSNADSQPPYFPGSMMASGFPIFGGQMMPGHMREVGMQYATAGGGGGGGHQPDVGSLLPPQMGGMVDSSSSSSSTTSQSHNVVLQTPLGTFHRYNSVLQQHLSGMGGYPGGAVPPAHMSSSSSRHGESGSTRRDSSSSNRGEKDNNVSGRSSSDIKPRDFHHPVTKLKVEEGVANHHDQRLSSSSQGDDGGDRRHSVSDGGSQGPPSGGSPLLNIRDSISVATSDSGSPKSDHVFSPNLSSSQSAMTWPPPIGAPPTSSSRQRHGSVSAAPEHLQQGATSSSSTSSAPATTAASEHSEQSKKHPLSEDDSEMMISKMHKFWSESAAAASGCPVGASSFPGGLPGAMASHLPMSVLQNSSLMSMYRKEAMLQFQQQQYGQQVSSAHHHKQYHNNSQMPPHASSSSQQAFPHADQPTTTADADRNSAGHYSNSSANSSMHTDQLPTHSPRDGDDDDANMHADHQPDSPPASPRSNVDTSGHHHLPELKNALSRPPMSSPSGWSGDQSSQRSETTTTETLDNNSGGGTPQPSEQHEPLYANNNSSGGGGKYAAVEKRQHCEVKRSASPSDPYFLNKKLKMKRRSSSDTVNSDHSVADAPPADAPPTPSHHGSVSSPHSLPPQRPQSNASSYSSSHADAEQQQQRKFDVAVESRHRRLSMSEYDTPQRRDSAGEYQHSEMKSTGGHVDVAAPHDESLANITQHHSHHKHASTLTSSEQSSQPADPPVLLRSPQFYRETESRDCRNSPPMLVPETETMDQQQQQQHHPHYQSSSKVRSSASPPRGPPTKHSSSYNHIDKERPGASHLSNHELKESSSKLRHHHANHSAYENNNNKYYNPEISKMADSVMPQQQKSHGGGSSSGGSKSGSGGVSGGHGMPNGVVGSASSGGGSGYNMGAGGVAAPPHPAYLPLPFPSVHPAIMYQYNQFAAAQMAQLQQLQMAQAQMALQHHQAAMSKVTAAESHYQQGMAAAAARGNKDGSSSSHRSADLHHQEQQDSKKPHNSSEVPLKDGRPLNLSKPQDIVDANQPPIYVKPEPL